MGRLSSSHLFDLVQCMHKSERRYFKIQAKAHGGESDYILLFDILTKMDKYNEEKLVASLKKKGKEKNLAFKKKHLYEILLRSLTEYHRDHRYDLQIPTILTKVYVTYHKGLFDQCEKLINKGLEMTRANLSPSYELLFLHWRHELMGHMVGTKIKKNMRIDNAREVFEQLKEEEADVLRRLQVHHEASNFYLDTSIIIRFGDFEAMEDMLNRLDDFENERDLKNLSPFARMKMLRARGAMQFVRKDFKAVAHTAREIMDIWESRPDMILLDGAEYAQTLNNIITPYLELRDYKEAKKYLNILEDWAADKDNILTPLEQLRGICYHQSNITRLLNMEKKYQECLSAFDHEWFTKTRMKLDAFKRTQILMEWSFALLMTGDFKQVIRLTTDALSRYDIYQKEMLSQVRILFYCAHFSKENFETLEQYYKSTDSLVKTWYKRFPQEKQFLGSLIKTLDGKMNKKELKLRCQGYPVKLNYHFQDYMTAWSKKI